MALKPGEYVFTCGECDGTGEIEVGNREYGDHDVVECEDCHGTGEVAYDEDEAEELIEEDGWQPLRTP